MDEINQDGLSWDYGLDIVPVWTREPSTTAIEAVCRRRLKVEPSDTCTISFHAEGAFNKLYLVETGGEQRLLMRVSLPVCPRHKTRGEATTLGWLRERTTIPVPRILDFDDGNDNEIGFEWMLMEVLPGSSAYSRWRRLSMAQKVFLTQRVAEFQVQLLRHGSCPGLAFRGVGTLESKDGSSVPMPGQLVSDIFFTGDHIQYDMPRGPFRSSHDWLLSHLKIASLEFEADLAHPEIDEDDKKDSEEMIVLVKRLMALLPKIFPSIQEPCERTALWHHDLGLNNILVDHQGQNPALVDWEGVSAVPLWMAAQVPRFLRDQDREEEPKRDMYADDDEEVTAGDPDPNDLDNEGKDSLYWIHLMEYETTQLRKIYHDKMRSLWPEWDLHVTDGKLKRDFYKALMSCFHGWFTDGVLKWVDKIEAGEYVGLETFLRPAGLVE